MILFLCFHYQVSIALIFLLLQALYFGIHWQLHVCPLSCNSISVFLNFFIRVVSPTVNFSHSSLMWNSFLGFHHMSKCVLTCTLPLWTSLSPADFYPKLPAQARASATPGVHPQHHDICQDSACLPLKTARQQMLTPQTLQKILFFYSTLFLLPKWFLQSRSRFLVCFLCICKIHVLHSK